MDDIRNKASQKFSNKGRINYYIRPTHDFTKYTRDCEEKYWNKETAFDWTQSVSDSLKLNLENLDKDELNKLVMMVLPMVKDKLEHEIESIKEQGLPIKEDVIKDIGECLPFESAIIEEALLIQSPLQLFEVSIKKLKDQLEIVQFELADLKELRRLELLREGIILRQLQTEKERQQQSYEISQLTDRFNQIKEALKQAKSQKKSERKQLQTKVCSELVLIEPKLLSKLEEILSLLDRTLKSKQLPLGEIDQSVLKDLILQRQLRALKDIANHALVVEQSAIAPLTMGIIHYKRYREIQEAMTTFIRDEAKHSATFRRYLVEKLEAKEYISAKLIKGANRYMWLARFMPATGMFIAVIVEIIGAAYLEFLANEKHMPDKLFCDICKTISSQDEKRHIDLCVAMYNELFRKAGNWERIRNKMALKKIMKSVYGDKDENHHLIQAFRAFGVESDVLYNYIIGQLSAKLARIGLYIKPQEILQMILGEKAKQIRFDT